MSTRPDTSSGAPLAEMLIPGRSISPGLGMGPAWVVGDVLKSNGPTTIAESGVNDELVRLSQSFDQTLAELDERAKRIEAEFDASLAGIFRPTAICFAT